MFSQFLKKQSWSTVWSGSQALQSKLSCADRGVASPNVTPLAGCTVYSSRINWLSINYLYIVSNKLMHDMVTLCLCISKFRYLNENEFLRHTSVLISEVYHPDTGGRISASICNSADIRLRVPNTVVCCYLAISFSIRMVKHFDIYMHCWISEIRSPSNQTLEEILFQDRWVFKSPYTGSRKLLNGKAFEIASFKANDNALTLVYQLPSIKLGDFCM